MTIIKGDYGWYQELAKMKVPKSCKKGHKYSRRIYTDGITRVKICMNCTMIKYVSSYGGFLTLAKMEKLYQDVIKKKNE